MTERTAPRAGDLSPRPHVFETRNVPMPATARALTLTSLSAGLLLLATGCQAGAAVLPTVEFETTTVEVDESRAAAVFKIKLSAATGKRVTVAYKTGPGNTDDAATPDKDFQAVSGQVSIAAGKTTARIRVPLIDDARAEPKERFRVVLTEALNAQIGVRAANGFILDNDAGAEDPADKVDETPTEPVKPTAHAYLNDVDRYTRDFFQAGPQVIESWGFPRIGLGDSPVSQSVEELTKYRFIAAQNVSKIAKVQAVNPDLLYLRLLTPSAYQPSTQMGMPFEGTGPATQGSDVFAGHWLYQAGSRTSAAIGAGDTTVRVDNANLFTAGTYAVIYAAPAGSFANAEHVFVKSVNKSTNTLTLGKRGYKSQARSHARGAIIAEHVTGEGRFFPEENWVYNQSTASPRDANGKTLGQAMAQWLSRNYNRNRNGTLVNVRVDGIQFDTDRYFLSTGKGADVDNDLVRDDGVANNGYNLWGEGLDRYYGNLRELLPNMLIVGGGTGARGWDKLNGTQWEGFPVDGGSFAVNPDYSGVEAQLANYSFHVRHHLMGPGLTHALNKSPTKLYPKIDDRASDKAPAPTSNAPFRFSFGMSLLDDGFYGQPGSKAHPDVWWDEYAVDVERGSPSFGRAIASNPTNEALIRKHLGWMGQPLGDRVRLYDAAAFAPERSLIANGGFESGLNGWSSKNVAISAGGGALEGSNALYAAATDSVIASPAGASIRGPKVELVKGEEYTLAFAIKSSTPRQVRVSVGNATTQTFLVPSGWARRVISFTAPTTASQQLQFHVGRESTEVWLDGVYFFKGSAGVFQRDFERARVVVNTTSQPRTIELGGTFQRIKGTGQDPVNDGSQVTRVTIPAYDAAILLKP